MLWETLAAVAMDRAVRLHHGCLRRLLRPFNGYESATGGHRTAERPTVACRGKATSECPCSLPVLLVRAPRPNARERKRNPMQACCSLPAVAARVVCTAKGKLSVSSLFPLLLLPPPTSRRGRLFYPGLPCASGRGEVRLGRPDGPPGGLMAGRWVGGCAGCSWLGPCCHSLADWSR